MKRKVMALFSIVLICFLLFANISLVVAQTRYTWGPMLRNWFEFVIGLTGMGDAVRNAEWDMIISYAAAFIGSLAIIFGLFHELQLFKNVDKNLQNKLFFIIALSWTILLIPTGILGTIVLTVFTFAGAYGTILFVIVFLAGAAIWGHGNVQMRRGITAGEISVEVQKAIDAMEKQKEDIISRHIQAVGGSPAIIRYIMGQKLYRQSNTTIVGSRLLGAGFPANMVAAVVSQWPSLQGSIAHIEREVGKLQATTYTPSKTWMFAPVIIGIGIVVGILLIDLFITGTLSSLIPTIPKIVGILPLLGAIILGFLGIFGFSPVPRTKVVVGVLIGLGLIILIFGG